MVDLPSTERQFATDIVKCVINVYGTKYLNLLTLVRYRCLCDMCISWINLTICIYNLIMFCLFVGQLSVHCAVLSCILANEDDDDEIIGAEQQ